MKLSREQRQRLLTTARAIRAFHNIEVGAEITEEHMLDFLASLRAYCDFRQMPYYQLEDKAYLRYLEMKHERIQETL